MRNLFSNLKPGGSALALASVLTFSATTGIGAPPVASPNFPALNLPAPAQGQAAISALGNTLPAVAGYYGKSVSEFARMLREDKSVWLDRQGRVYFVDEFPEPADSEPPASVQAAPFPLGETFNLESRPGARRVIYLDFNGHTISGTSWNVSYGDPIVAIPYSRDSDHSSFSDSELEDIQNMWRQVSEDFAPFEINVTTKDPGYDAMHRDDLSDQYFGTRVVITDDTFASCGCGGFAYLRAFDDTNDNRKPAFVFNTSLVGAGEAITHEAGHNLGLSHDGLNTGTTYYQGHGSGVTGWAPIMGVGYYQPLVQWSKGEYFDANETQDDLYWIDYYGGLLMADDHGDTNGTAAALGADSDGTTVTLSGAGLIHTPDDVDVFSFSTGGGSFNLGVNPAPFSPNLDIVATLYDGSGGFVMSNNPTDSLPAALSGSLSAGQYFLHIDGTGKGNPQDTGYTDYGSLGRYTVSGTASDPGGLTPPVADASVSYAPGEAPLTAYFDGSGSSDGDGSISSYSWDFGDSESGTGVAPSHTYDEPGSYTAVLTVTDDDGLTDTASASVEVDNRLPVAVASVDITSGTAPLTVQFTGSSSYDPDASGSIANYAWSFGDGGISSDADPQYIYNSADSFTASLTVTDNLGGTDAATVSVDVDPPAEVDQFTSADEFGSGSVSGSHTATQATGGAAQSITERESGGRKSNRHSYLVHTWLFNVAGGDLVELFAEGSHSPAGDGDLMEFSYSVNGAGYQPINVDLSSTDSVMLSSATVGGQVRIRVEDSDQDPGNRALDTVELDYLMIRTHNSSGPAVPPAAASNLVATAVSSSQIDLTWQDESTDEFGFRVERSAAGAGSWSEVGSVGSDIVEYPDTGLSADTSYDYRVIAFNGADAPASNVVSATTQPGSDITLTVNGYKVKGVKTIDLSWTGLNGATAYIFLGSSLRDTTTASTYQDTQGKGGGSYTYKVCADDAQAQCSDPQTVVF